MAHVGDEGLHCRRPSLPEELAPVLRHLESTWPREGCGVLLRAGPDGPWRVCPLHNAYDTWHARDAVRYPRTSRTAYLFEPRDWLALLLQAEARGEQLVCVFHSHVDAPAYFSAEDRQEAAPGGAPLLPGVAYLVVGIEAARARTACLAWWEDGHFLECQISVNS